jgi:hypothetical protein
MKTKFLTLSAIAIVALTCSFAVSARAAENLSDLDNKSDSLTLDEQVKEVDGYSYDDYANQTKIEAQASESEVKQLNQKIKQLEQTKRVNEAKARTETERLQASEKRKSEMLRRAATLEAEQKVAQQRLSKTEANIKILNDQTIKARERADQAKKSYDLAMQKQKEDLRRQRQLQAEIKAHQRQQQLYQAKRLKLSNQKLQKSQKPKLASTNY